MRLLRVFVHRLHSLLRRSHAEADLQREIDLHLEQLTKEFVAAGMSEKEARLLARREFGAVEATKEDCRDRRRVRTIEEVFRDISYAFRLLRKSPGFTLTALLSLALGIGATTAIFSVTRTVLLKPLAYRDSDRLVTILFRVPQFSKTLSTIPVNAQHYQLWRDSARTLEELGMLGPDSHILSGLGEAVQVNGARVSSNFFHVLGSQPAVGRSFAKGEDQPGREHVVVISHALWREKLGGRPDALGHKILLDGQPFQVIGVMPAGFPFPRGKELSDIAILPDRVDYWIPLVFSKDDLATPFGNENFVPIARLKPATTITQAVSEIETLEKVISKRYPEPVRLVPVIRRLQLAMARDVRLPLLLLMAAVGAVLLIVCINLMNLMMVRGLARQREWAIRLSIGARRRDLVRGALVESLCLSIAGGTLGSLLAWWLLKLTQLRAPTAIPRIDELALDWPTLLFALALSMASAILFGVWPTWRSTQVDPHEALKSSRTGSQGPETHRAGKLLVAAEVALSTMLLLTGGLLFRSLIATLGVDPGLKVQHQLLMRINLPPDRYQQGKDIHSFYQRLQEQVRSFPGVTAVGLISDVPLTGENNNNPATAGDRPTPPITQWQMTNYRSASGTYFAAAGIRLKAGRPFEERDGDKTEVMISDNLAAQLWPGQSAIGRPVRIYSYKEMMTVVGVVGSVHAASLTEDPTMMVYFPDWQRGNLNLSLVLRTEKSTQAVGAAVRSTVRALEPQAAIPSVQTMTEIVASSVSQQRLQVILLATFAFAALSLACLGIYGVLSFATRRRTSEIGIRMALGARPEQILGATLRSGMLPVMLGMMGGFVVSVGISRVIGSLLFGVRALDPLMYSITALVLLIVAGLACLLPARRAAGLNPVEALRHE